MRGDAAPARAECEMLGILARGCDVEVCARDYWFEGVFETFCRVFVHLIARKPCDYIFLRRSE